MRHPWGDDSSDEESAGLLSNPKQDYQSTQEQALREHEEGLGKLGEAIKRQKYMANEIATEVDVQNEILDVIDDGMARTNEIIRKNARNINLVTKKSSTFYLWLIIVILAIVIGALAIM